MKKVAVIICNYNKKDYILKCIDSVKKSTYSNFDIYVVDNASNDGSVKAINEKFGDEIVLFENNENLGGSGGFNTGIKKVIDREYKYIYLLDNDVIIENYALENLYEYMEINTDVGVCGSAIYSMDKPDNIQEFGSFVDFNIFNMKLQNRGKLEINDKEVIECDYVPACSALFRVESLKQVGTIDEDYFVYWDDIDLCHRLRLAKYKVIANYSSKVWHKGGGTIRKNTFGTYYFWRNRVYFFTKYCDVDQITDFSVKLFEDIFQATYSCNYIGKYSSPQTILMAVSDALNNVRGKASDNRILETENIQDKLECIVSNKENLLIINKSELKVLVDVLDKIKSKNQNVHITVLVDDKLELKNELKDYNVLGQYEMKDFTNYDLVLETCNHIFDKIESIDNDIVYVDRFFNIISNDEERTYIKNYGTTYNMLKNIWYPIMLSKILELKSILSN